MNKGVAETENQVKVGRRERMCDVSHIQLNKGNGAILCYFPPGFMEHFCIVIYSGNRKNHCGIMQLQGRLSRSQYLTGFYPDIVLQ